MERRVGSRSGSPTAGSGRTRAAMSDWRLWVQHPEKSRIRNFLFHIHVWVGVAASAYVFMMSLSGSIIVFRDQGEGVSFVEWLVNLHDNLLSRGTGQFINGLGGICLLLLCLTGAVIWWPGVTHWRRSLTVSWRSHFPRISWDLHSAVGFWFFLFICVWSLSATYFGIPGFFNFLYTFDPQDRMTDRGWFVLSQLHFGRFGRILEMIWSIAGLSPGVLAFTGMFICCRRVIFKKPSNPKVEAR